MQAIKKPRLAATDPKTFGNNSRTITQHVSFSFLGGTTSLMIFSHMRLFRAQCQTGVAGLVLYRSEIYYNVQAGTSLAPKQSWELILLGKEGDTIQVEFLDEAADTNFYGIKAGDAIHISGGYLQVGDKRWTTSSSLNVFKFRKGKPIIQRLSGQEMKDMAASIKTIKTKCLENISQGVMGMFLGRSGVRVAWLTNKENKFSILETHFNAFTTGTIPLKPWKVGKKLIFVLSQGPIKAQVRIPECLAAEFEER